MNYVPRVKGHIQALDGLRGIAVLSVMAFHFMVFGTALGRHWWEKAYFMLAGIGWMGVDLFFVLSGFLITGILWDSRGREHYFRVFYGRRTVRIFPLYYVALAVMFLVMPVAASVKAFSWTYTLNWLIAFRGFETVPHPMHPFWSLCVEEQFYLVWPFLVSRLRRRRLMQVCLAMIVAAFVLRVLLATFYPVAAIVLTFSRMDSLAVGALIALCARDGRDWDLWRKTVKWAKWPAMATVAAVLVGTRTPWFTNFWMSTVGISMVAIVAGAAVTWAIAGGNGMGMYVLRSKSLGFFGTYSYCLYVVHQPLILWMAKRGWVGTTAMGIVEVNVVALGLAVGVALVSWKVMEKQMLRLKDLPLLQNEGGA
jgi:peptidoglycan/LPS O-acetylase OafA/YrhL